MRIACPSCRKVFTLDDARLPAKPATMKCPSCGSGIPVSPPAGNVGAKKAEGGGNGGPAESRSAAPERPGSPALPEPGTEGWERLKREVAAAVLEQLGVEIKGGSGGALAGEDDDLRALVCEDEALFQLAISEAVEKLGFRPEVASSKKAALDALEKKSYSLVTVDNRLPDDPEGGYGILQHINLLPPELRRSMFVAFISADLSTMDTNSAFILGANITVAKKDVKKLDKVLAQGIREHESKYRLFREVEEEIQRLQS